MRNILIGIDPGTTTGLAFWDGKDLRLHSTTITLAIFKVMELKADDGTAMHVFLEDARKRQWLGNAGRERLMGAGSIKRDCSIWETFLKEQGIPYTLVSPKNNKTKMSKEQFNAITGYNAGSNEHSRDAAMLVFGRDTSFLNCKSDKEILLQILNS